MLQTLVVDDEKLARDDLCWMLEREADIGEIVQAASGAEALKLLTGNSGFGVVFLDMKMPDLDGLDIARTISRFEETPAIVFVTAFDTPASDAFDLGVLDYLRKPVAADRLTRAGQKVVAAQAQPGSSTAVTQGTARLLVSTSGGSQVVLRPPDVTHFESCGDYVRVYTADASHLVRDTMARLTNDWATHGFVRIHRSHSVRMSAVTEVRASANGRSVIVDGTELPVSRRYARDLTSRLAGDRAESS